MGTALWESGEEWIDGDSGTHLDVMVCHVGWSEEQSARILECHEASVGYTTCSWSDVRTSRCLCDRTGWFAALQAAAQRP